MNKLLQINTQNASVTMSSREIAESTDKNHSDVMRDIRAMTDKLQKANLLFVCNSSSYIGLNGQSYTMYELDYDTTMTLLLGYDPVARMKVVKRWQELENQTQLKIPQTLPEALRFAADQAERADRLQLVAHQQAVQLESMESYFRNGISPFEFVKSLNGVNSLKIGEFLVAKNWLYQDGKDRKRVAAYARDQYLTEENIEVAAHGCDPFLAFKPVLLKKGAMKIYDWYARNKLPMKKTWNGEFTQNKAVGL